MKSYYLLAVSLFALLFVECRVSPTVVVPTTTGGVSSSGGSPSVIGGTTTLGGTSSVLAGGSGGVTTVTSTTATDDVNVTLECSDSAPKSADTVKRSLSGWKKPTKAIKRKDRPSYSIIKTVRNVFWEQNCSTPEIGCTPFDQGKLGSCTGSGDAQCLSTQPFTAILTNVDGVKIYARATEVDTFAGTYPPTDTGSSVEAAVQASRDLGYFTGMSSTIDTLEGLQEAIQYGPCLIGIDWYNAMFEPTRCGELLMKGGVAGGHALGAVAWDAKNQKLILRNTWGPTYGKCRVNSRGIRECGYVYMSAGTVQNQLNRGAEIVCLRP